MKNKIIVLLLIAFGIYFTSCNSQRYTDWQYDVKFDNLNCEKVRYHLTNDRKDTATIECVLKNNSVIDGFPCSYEKVSLSKDWKLKSFVLSEDFAINANVIPKGTFIRIFNDKLLCMFPEDTEFQSYLCKGNFLKMGTEGIQTSLYRSGRLRNFFPVEDIKLNNVLCKSSPFAFVGLYENGMLRKCKLAEDQVIAGVKYKKNAKVYFDENGNVIDE